MSAEILGGVPGITLGSLALIGIERIPLLTVSAIVFGGALIFGSPAIYRRAGPNLNFRFSM